MGRKKKRKGGRSNAGLTAKTADKYQLYQWAVQDPAGDAAFLERAWREVYGDDGEPLHLREDFCGTALLCSEWVRTDERRSAEGVDLDPECLAWGRTHNLEPLADSASRVELRRADVRDVVSRLADIRLATNFSYQVFHHRDELAGYLRAVLAGLSPRGIFVMDMYGGTEALEELEESREIEEGGFTYVWDQEEYWPGTARTLCSISFRFPDGSKMKNAFRYDWRLWTMPELKELLVEVGFSEVRSYFEEFDEEGDGTGYFAQDDRGQPCEGWLAYLVAIP